MDIVIISLVACFASILTFFAGFGLGTILLPAFALFFPIEIAVALTGIVHLLNNLFKMALVGVHADWRVVFKFGVPAIIGAIIGAWLLMYVAGNAEWYRYTIGNRECVITPVKVIIAILMALFAIIEIIPAYRNLEMDRRHLPIGGLFSGFFGGLSGHQGALRSAFLIKSGLSKEAFIATGVMIASVIDISRISVYFSKYSKMELSENWPILLAAILSAFVGAVIGKLVLKKITIDTIHYTVMVLILILSILLGFGIV
jgi:uncharacterized membrane protein YfcA